MIPFALKVVTIGASTVSAKASSSCSNPIAPFPAMMQGRFDLFINVMALSNSSLGGAISGAATRPLRGVSGIGSRAESFWTSSGKMSAVGPCSTSACLIASAIKSDAFFAPNTVCCHRVTELNAAFKSTS